MMSFKQFLKESETWNDEKSNTGTRHRHSSTIDGNEVNIEINHHHDHHTALVDFSVNRSTSAPDVPSKHAISIMRHIHRTVKKKIKEINPKTVGWASFDKNSKMQEKKDRMHRAFLHKDGLNTKQDKETGLNVVKLRELFLKDK